MMTPYVVVLYGDLSREKRTSRCWRNIFTRPSYSSARSSSRSSSEPRTAESYVARCAVKYERELSSSSPRNQAKASGGKPAGARGTPRKARRVCKQPRIGQASRRGRDGGGDRGARRRRGEHEGQPRDEARGGLELRDR